MLCAFYKNLYDLKMIGVLNVVNLQSVVYDDSVSNWKMDPSSTLNHIMIFVNGGQLTYTIDGEAIHLMEGDFLYIPANTYRSGSNVFNQPHQKYSAHFKVTNLEVNSALLKEGVYRKTNVRNFHYIEQRFGLLFQHWVERLPSYDVICLGILFELIGLMERGAHEQQLSIRKVEMVTKIKKYIIKHYRQQIKIADLADIVDRSPNYVTNTFKEVTGQSPIQYLHYVRVSAAKDLLKQSDMSLIEIADYLGFCDQSYFSKVFKSILGMPPSSFNSLSDEKNN